MSGPVRVLLVDDQELFREGLRTLLERVDGLEVVGEAVDGADAVTAAERLRPDVVLMDLRMPGTDGVQATRLLADRRPEIRVLVLTTFDDDERIVGALRAGACGYLLKDTSSARLADAVFTAARGGTALDPAVATRVVDVLRRGPPAGGSDRPPRTHGSERPGAPPEELSERELQILRELATGASNREISRRVFLAEGTVKNYVSSILAKLEARDRTQAALAARELGLLDEPPRD